MVVGGMVLVVFDGIVLASGSHLQAADCLPESWQAPSIITPANPTQPITPNRQRQVKPPSASAPAVQTYSLSTGYLGPPPLDSHSEVILYR